MGKQRQQNQSKKAKQTKNESSTFPPYLLNKNAAKKKIHLSALVPNAVYVGRDFMDQSECNAFVKFAEGIGFEKLCSPQTREYAQRECGRISRNDWDFAGMLYQRMKPIVEQIAREVEVPNAEPITCNGNLRLYKYEKHMSFGRHFDGSENIPKVGNTEITVLVYLTSCKGGATRFYLPSSTKRSSKKKKAKDEYSDGIAFTPEAGAILLHMHGDRCLEHEADPVIDGIKYVLRTDIVYAPKS